VKGTSRPQPGLPDEHGSPAGPCSFLFSERPARRAGRRAGRAPPGYARGSAVPGDPFVDVAVQLGLVEASRAERYEDREALVADGLLSDTEAARVDAFLAGSATRVLPARPSGRLIGRPGGPGPDPGAEPDPDPAPSSRDAPTQDVPGGPRGGEGEADVSPEGFWSALDPPPERIGSYRVLGEIGRGGMGVILRAHHADLDREVAIKLLRPDVEGDAEAEARFLREARSAAKLRHPGIVQVHDVGKDDAGRPYLVMELVQGRTLKDLLHDDGPLEPLEAARVIEAVARAVDHAHGHEVLHRDLKPHNVLLDAASGEPRLTDFGLAKSLRSSGSDSSFRLAAAAAASRGVDDLTLTGHVMGTPLYMAPEQCDPSRGRVSARTDVYALGVLLYECLTGLVPFSGDSVQQVFRRILDERPALPSAQRRQVPPGLDEIVMRCLEKRPRARYASAGELAAELARFRAGTPVLSGVHRSAPAPSGTSPLHLAVLAVLVAIAGVAWSLRAGELGGSAAGAPEDAPSAVAPTPTTLIVVDEAGGVPAPGVRLSPVRLTTANVARQAEAGYADAMLALGHAILRGDVAEGTNAAGLDWIARAAEQGYPEACRALGMLYRDGRLGVTADREAARHWLRRGAELESVPCMLQLGAILLEDGGAEGRAEARRWLESAARTGDPSGQTLLGELLVRGDPGERRRAVDLFEAAAAQGEVRAMHHLAEVHAEGIGAPVDPATAREWLERAAAAGSVSAMLRLGEACERGADGAPPDPAAARGWYEQAAAAGSAEARERLAALGSEE